MPLSVAHSLGQNRWFLLLFSGVAALALVAEGVVAKLVAERYVEMGNVLVVRESKQSFLILGAARGSLCVPAQRHV